ncbi:hypothetical protein [Streptomyces sp. S465]|uniref:hypothetical protein n=1 Tax=Streptomyces sp. S465 TaxID=2979468 RepID=UPI003FCDD6C2
MSSSAGVPVPRRGPKSEPLLLADDERAVLERWTRRANSAQALASEIPKNATHWSRESMAEHSGLSKSTVGRIWRKFQLKPHLTDTFKLSTGVESERLVAVPPYDLAGALAVQPCPQPGHGRQDDPQIKIFPRYQLRAVRCRSSKLACR